MMNMKTYKENVSLMLYSICTINRFLVRIKSLQSHLQLQ